MSTVCNIGNPHLNMTTKPYFTFNRNRINWYNVIKGQWQGRLKDILIYLIILLLKVKVIGCQTLTIMFFLAVSAL